MTLKFKNNSIRFFHDFGGWQNIPPNIEFNINKGPHDALIELVADGYGGHDKYGNGSLYVLRKDLSHYMIRKLAKHGI